MSQERLTDLMFGMILPPTSPLAVRQSVIDTLTELESLHGKKDGLTEEEYTGWRTSILDSIALNRHPESVFLVACGIFGLLLGGLLAYGLMGGNVQWAWGAGIGFVVLALMTVRLARGLAAKKRMTVAERLELVVELTRLGLVTAGEATELGTRIARLAPGAPSTGDVS